MLRISNKDEMVLYRIAYDWKFKDFVGIKKLLNAFYLYSIGNLQIQPRLILN